jgi:alkylhydroperoxidase family enzyme
MGTWLPETADAETEFDAVFGLRPDLAEAYRDFEDVFWSQRLLDPVVLELCRLRCAQLLRCQEALATRTPMAVEAGLDEQLVAALPEWPHRAEFSDLQRACLAFAEQFVLDPHGVSEEQRAAARAHVGDAGLVALAEALAIFDGFARFRTILGIERGGEGTPARGE